MINPSQLDPYPKGVFEQIGFSTKVLLSSLEVFTLILYDNVAMMAILGSRPNYRRLMFIKQKMFFKLLWAINCQLEQLISLTSYYSLANKCLTNKLQFLKKCH